MSDSPSGRFVALDRLRALAVLLMIQGHAFFELLDPAATRGTWYRLHKLVHGLTAPMFLMGAGLAFGITTYPRWERFRTHGAEHHARLRRYALIVLLGYALQLPGHSLRSLGSPSPDVWRTILAVGPLQLIGVTLLFAQLGTRVLPTPRSHALGALTLGLVVTLVAPFAWNVAPASPDASGLLAFLNGRTRSQFPVFPWAAFVLGALALSVACTSARGARWLRSGLRWGVAGALACGVTYALYRARVNPYGEHDFWHSSPLYTVFRAGGVALFLALVSVLASRPGKLDRGLAILSRHSLLAYVTHLLLLYGSFPVPGMVHALGRGELGIEAATLASLGLIVATVAVIVAWRHIRHTGLIPNSFQRLTRLLSGWHTARATLGTWTESETHVTERSGVHGSVSPAPRSS